jgi:hypothetical protein
VNNWRTWLIGIFLALPSLFLATVGIIELRDGVAVDATFPVPNFLSNGTAMPKAAYRDAAELLGKSNGLDGDAQISRAESMFYAGDRPRQALAVMENGLGNAPASSEGWTYYAAMLMGGDPKKAGQALDQAFTVAPYDYFLAGMRARLGALLWPDLDEQTRDEALRQARVLWEEPSLRDQLLPLLGTSEGARLMTRAYGQSPETIRNINRWVEARRRKSSHQGS